MPGSKWRLLKWLVGGGQGSGGDTESGGEKSPVLLPPQL